MKQKGKSSEIGMGRGAEDHEQDVSKTTTTTTTKSVVFQRKRHR
jgi:hypothetical protein